ncbi:MAG: hypothetical protein AAGA58_14500 [Verrucomicrobiota bacterium]
MAPLIKERMSSDSNTGLSRRTKHVRDGISVLLIPLAFLFSGCETTKTALHSDSSGSSGGTSTIGVGTIQDSSGGMSEPGRLVQAAGNNSDLSLITPLPQGINSTGEAAAFGAAMGLLGAAFDAAAQARFNREYGHYFADVKSAAPTDIDIRFKRIMKTRMQNEGMFATHFSESPSHRINVEIKSYGYSWAKETRHQTYVMPAVYCVCRIESPGSSRKMLRVFVGKAEGYKAPISEFAGNSKQAGSGFDSAINDAVSQILRHTQGRLERSFPGKDYPPIGAGLVGTGIQPSIVATPAHSIPAELKTLTLPFGKPVSTLTLSNTKPYRLTQDSGMLAQAQHKVKISGLSYRVGGSHDGAITLLMSTISSLDIDRNDPSNPLHKIQSILSGAGVTITQVREVKNLGTVVGYFILSDGDSYSQIKNLND